MHKLSRNILLKNIFNFFNFEQIVCMGIEFVCLSLPSLFNFFSLISLSKTLQKWAIICLQGGQPLQAYHLKFRFVLHSRPFPFIFVLAHRSSAQLYSLCIFPILKP